MNITDGFPVEPTPDGKWEVHVGNKIVIAQSKKDADLLAVVPILHKKVASQKATKADVSHIRRILSVCTLYRYNSSATRHLASWLSKQAEMAVK